MRFRNLFLIFFTLFFIFSCTSEKKNEQTFNNFPENYSFGIIETANRIFSQTRIRVYDDKGQVLDSLVVPKAGIYEGFRPAFISRKSNFLYLPIVGSITKGESAIFELNILTGTINLSEYENGVHVIVEDDKDTNIIFFGSNEQVIQWDKQNKRVLLKGKIPTEYRVEDMQINQHNIYLFTSKTSTSENTQLYLSSLLILDKKNLNILKEIDLTSKGFGHFNSLIINNFLYFSSNANSNAQELEPNYTLNCFNVDDHTITDYPLFAEFPYLITSYQNNLIITHTFPPEPKINILSLFNLTSTNNKIYPIQNIRGFYQIAVQGDYLYALESYNLHVYDLKNEFEEVAVYPTKTPIGNQKYPTFGNSSHVSAFFLNPKND